MGAVELVGVPDEVRQDQRVVDAIADLERKPERDAGRTIVQTLQNGVEKYGIKLRPISLTVVGPMMAQMMSFKPSFPEAYQMTAMLFILGAPLRDVYSALSAGECGGVAEFMAIAADWVMKSGIPQDMSDDVVRAVQNTFETAGRLLGGGKDDGEKKE